MQITHVLSWTEEQKASQAELNRRLQENRQETPARDVPPQAQRNGTING